MIKIAITGNIASGKSQAENILVSMGLKVIDADKVNQNLLDENIEVKNEIKSIFGLQVFNETGAVSKQKLGSIVFSSDIKRKQLENILHKRIIEKINIFFDENKNEKLVFAAVPLLFEAEWENYFDKIILVCAPEEKRLKRLTNRSGCTEDEALKRIRAQMPEAVKIKKADFIINNNSDLASLKKSVINIISKFD